MEDINEKVSVYTWFDRIKGEVKVVWVRWQGKNYKILHQDYHKKQRNGRVVFHEYYVATATLTFHLIFDPDTLHWILKDTQDGHTTQL